MTKLEYPKVITWYISYKTRLSFLLFWQKAKVAKHYGSVEPKQCMENSLTKTDYFTNAEDWLEALLQNKEPFTSEEWLNMAYREGIDLTQEKWNILVDKNKIDLTIEIDYI
jgi:hypothetical protein